MYYVMDAHSFYNFIYFILLIIVSIRASSGPWTMETRDGQCPQEALRAGELGRTGGGGGRCRQSIPTERIVLNVVNQLVIEGPGRAVAGSIHHFSSLDFNVYPTDLAYLSLPESLGRH